MAIYLSKNFWSYILILKPITSSKERKSFPILSEKLFCFELRAQLIASTMKLYQTLSQLICVQINFCKLFTRVRFGRGPYMTCPQWINLAIFKPNIFSKTLFWNRLNTKCSLSNKICCCFPQFTLVSVNDTICVFFFCKKSWVFDVQQKNQQKPQKRKTWSTRIFPQILLANQRHDLLLYHSNITNVENILKLGKKLSLYNLNQYNLNF